MELSIVHQGFDGLDVAFQCALPSPVRAALGLAKATAMADGNSCPHEINGIHGLVYEQGAKGGYAFVFDTGPDGEIWTIKDNPSPQNWNVRVSVRAAQLAVEGYHAVRDHLFASLAAMGATVLAESVSRVDFAVDFVAPDFALSPNDFVAHSKADVSEHSDIPKGGEGDGFMVHYRGRKAASVTVGRMPSRQIIVYDKRREAINLGKGFWFEIWGLDKNDCPPVWRVEVRAGKRHLKDWRITTFDELEARLGDLFAKAMGDVRMVVLDGSDSNVTRAPNHPLWQMAAVTVADALDAWRSGATRGRVVEGRREELRQMYQQQIVGLATSYAVVAKMTVDVARKRLADLVQSDVWMGANLDPREFARRHAKAEGRMFFLGEVAAMPPP